MVERHIGHGENEKYYFSLYDRETAEHIIIDNTGSISDHWLRIGWEHIVSNPSEEIKVVLKLKYGYFHTFSTNDIEGFKIQCNKKSLKNC